MDPELASVDTKTDYMLTTSDNPYDPFSHWDEWYQWDEAAGYHTCALLARITRTSDNISEVDQELAIQQAIDEICFENVSGVHVKVARVSDFSANT